jgi:hypothetical protein
VSWAAVIGLGLGSYACKALGLFAGDRLAVLRRAEPLLALLPAALLAALVIVQTFDGGQQLVLDARVLGVGAGAIAAWRRAPFIVVVVLAATVTAVARQL